VCDVIVSAGVAVWVKQSGGLWFAKSPVSIGDQTRIACIHPDMLDGSFCKPFEHDLISQQDPFLPEEYTGLSVPADLQIQTEVNL